MHSTFCTEDGVHSLTYNGVSFYTVRLSEGCNVCFFWRLFYIVAMLYAVDETLDFWGVKLLRVLCFVWQEVCCMSNRNLKLCRSFAEQCLHLFELSISKANRSKRKFYSQHRITKVALVDRYEYSIHLWTAYESSNGNNRGSNSETLSTSEQYRVLPAMRTGGAAEAMYLPRP